MLHTGHQYYHPITSLKLSSSSQLLSQLNNNNAEEEKNENPLKASPIISESTAITSTKSLVQKKVGESKTIKQKEEAERLRQKATDLMKEANTAEIELQKRLQKSIKNDELDYIIHEFIQMKKLKQQLMKNNSTLVNAIITPMKKEAKEELVNEITILLRHRQYSKFKMIKLIERLVEREFIVRDKDKGEQQQLFNKSMTMTTKTTTRRPLLLDNNSNPTKNSFTIGDVMNSISYNQHEYGYLYGLVDCVINAQIIVDNENNNKTRSIAARKKNNNIAHILQAKVRELKQMYEEKYQRELANYVNKNDNTHTTARPTTIKNRNNIFDTMRIGGNSNGSSNRIKGNGDGQQLLMDNLMEDTFNTSFYQGTEKESKNVSIRIDGMEIITSLAESRATTLKVIKNRNQYIQNWMPSFLRPYILLSFSIDNNEISLDEFKTIRSKVLLSSDSNEESFGFDCKTWDSTDLAAIYRGDFVGKKKQTIDNTMNRNNGEQEQQDILTKEEHQKLFFPLLNNIFRKGEKKSPPQQPLSSLAFQEIQNRLETIDNGKIAKKIQLFLLYDPEWRPSSFTSRVRNGRVDNNENHEPPAVILAVAKGVTPDFSNRRSRIQERALMSLSILSTLCTTLAYSATVYALNPTFFNTIVNNDPSVLLKSSIPFIFIGVIGLNVLHEVAHYQTAKKWNIKLANLFSSSSRLPLPSFELGSYGCITPIRSFPPNRTSLFDLAISGPMITFTISIGMIFLSLWLTVHAPSLDDISTMPMIPVRLLKSSFLIGSIVSFMTPKLLTVVSISQPIPIHSMFLIGYSGVIASALHMLPFGRLDGGRACMAVFGRRSTRLITLFTALFVSINVVGVSSCPTISLGWGLFVFLFQRKLDVPVRDEVTNINDFRFRLYVTSIVLTMLTLTPFPR